jgi:hypothetical protein
LVLMAFPVDFFFFFSRSSISKNMMWQTVWVRLTSRRSLKVKNMQKRRNQLCSVKTKSKGIVSKTPRINGKQVQVLIKLSNNHEYDLLNYKVHGCILHASIARDCAECVPLPRNVQCCVSFVDDTFLWSSQTLVSTCWLLHALMMGYTLNCSILQWGSCYWGAGAKPIFKFSRGQWQPSTGGGGKLLYLFLKTLAKYTWCTMPSRGAGSGRRRWPLLPLGLTLLRCVTSIMTQSWEYVPMSPRESRSYTRSCRAGGPGGNNRRNEAHERKGGRKPKKPV